jgi:hypothetical protein
MLHILWFQNLVQLTTGCGISHKTMKYAIQNYYKYFKYSIKILHQLHYTQSKMSLFLNISNSPREENECVFE